MISDDWIGGVDIPISDLIRDEVMTKQMQLDGESGSICFSVIARNFGLTKLDLEQKHNFPEWCAMQNEEVCTWMKLRRY